MIQILRRHETNEFTRSPRCRGRPQLALVDPRPLLVGLARAPSPPSERAMDGSSGDFLARLLGVPREEFHTLFLTGSLLPGLPPPARAQVTLGADILMRSWAWRSCPRVVLLGRDVGAAFGLRYDGWLEWFRAFRKEVALLPYPSGRNRWWNEAENREAGGKLLRSALGKDPERQRRFDLL